MSVFPDVANLPLRSPALNAKAAATIDRLSGGRFELGLGAGAFWDAIEALGGPCRSPGESLDALAEAIEVIRRVRRAQPSVRRPLLPPGRGARRTRACALDRIWVGAYGPRALRLTARLVDGWVRSFRGELQPIADMAARLDDAAADAGREPAAVCRILNVGGTITDSRSEAPLRGTVDQWADELTDLVTTHGFDSFVLWAEGEDQLRRFAEEVVPATRARIARERSRS